MKFLRRWAVLLGCLGIIGCGDSDLKDRIDELTGAEPERLRVPPADAATAEGQTGLTFRRLEVLDEAERPTLCLVFSAPLDPRGDYEPYVAIDRQVAVEPDGQRLCIIGLQYGEQAELTLRRGLPSLDGQALPANETVTLTFADRPPMVRFAGNGVVLPRAGGDGLTVSTVNVDAVQVTIDRLDDRALVFKRITEGFAAEEGQWRYQPAEERPGKLGARVFEGTLQTPGPPNALTMTALPLGDAVPDLRPGAYHVTVTDARAAELETRNPARAERWIVVTDLAMTAYRGTGGLDVTVRSLQTAQPARGLAVRLLSVGNIVLAEASTGRDGRVHFDAPLLRGEDGMRPRLLTVTGPEDFAFLDLDRAPLDLSAQPVGGLSPTDRARAHLYLDRGIYRPGETVHASALVRNAQGYALADRPGTLVLYRPNGLEQARRRFDGLGPAGSLQHAFTLPEAASRGVWRIALELDGLGEAGSVRLNVEDFVPQRLSLDLEADTAQPMAAGETRMIRVGLRFLYGAPGAGLEVGGTARMEADPDPFDGYEGFRFGLDDQPFSQLIVDMPKAVTDGEGEASLPLSPGNRGADAAMPLRLRPVIRAREPGGRAIQDDLRVPYRPRPVYLGLKAGFEGAAEQGEPTVFSLAAIGRDGTAVEREVTWRLRRRDYDYDWYQDSAGRWRWRRSERIVRVAQGAAVTSDAGPVRIETAALPWGDYDIVAAIDGDDLASMRFWVGYGGRSADGSPAPDSVRVLGPDAPVATGTDARVAITAPYPGIAEIAIATNEVISLRHVVVPGNGTEISVPVTEDWGSGAYVLVSVYTDRNPRIQPVPRRAIGAAYIPVDTADRRYDVALELPDLARPETALEVGIRIPDAPPDEDIYATLAAVDEGILLLTKFDSPAPEDGIFGKDRLGIDIYDDYGRVLDPNAAEAGVLRSGGDAIGGAGLTAVPTKTVALYEGPVRLDRDGSGTVTFELPDFNGELRLMAVAWSRDGVGSASEPLTVRDPVPAELILPRFLAPGDEAVATLTIDNVEGPAGSYRAQVAEAGQDPQPVISVAGGIEDVDLTRGEREDRGIAVSARRAGVTALSLQVDGPDQFRAARRYPLEVRSAFVPVRRTERIVLRPSESFDLQADTFAALRPGSGEVRVTASATPIATESLRRTLMDYPFACTEQLVSQATPLLLDRERTAAESGRLQRIVNTLLERQSPDGAFGMWRVGDRMASPWLGAYTSDFLARAADQGFAVPGDALDRAYRALQPVSQGEMQRAYGYDTRSARSPFSEDSPERLQERSGAYALYVLTRGGTVDRSRLRYVHDAALEDIESPLARAHIAAALAHLGDEGRARSAFEAAMAARGYENAGDWYQSPLRDDAAIAELLAAAGRLEDAAALLLTAERRAPEAERLDTQERAFLLRAAAATGSEGTAPELAYRNRTAGAFRLTDEERPSGAFTNPGDTPVFVTIETTGIPIAPPAEAAEQLSVTKRLLTLDGEPASPAEIARGDRMIVSLAITPGREARAQYVVTDLLPAGFEIEAVLGPEDGGPRGPFPFLGELTALDIAEARDDRFVASEIMRGTETRRMAYLVRAVTPGDFAAPGAVAHDMYRADVFARSPSGRVVIAP